MNAAGIGNAGNKYQAFVKRWYGIVKQENATWKMPEVMAELAKRYRAEKEREYSSAQGYALSKKVESHEAHPLSVKNELEAIVIESDEEPPESGDVRSTLGRSNPSSIVQ